MRELLPLALAAIAALAACDRQQGDRRSDSEVASEVRNMVQNSGFAQCVRDRIAAPWKVVDASVHDNDFVVRLAAAAADLQLVHRDNDSRQQRSVDVSIGAFTTHSVFDPKLLAGYLNDGTVRAAAAARDVPAIELAPLDVYEFGSADVLLLINPGRGEFCIDRAVPPHWPNPFARCQLVVEPYAAGFTISSEALRSLPRVFTQVRQLVDQATTCFNLYKERDHG
jgi:hypothetical protein